MAIAAKRFSVLSGETNLPSSKFGAGKLDDIINIAANELKTTPTGVEGLIKTSGGMSLSSVKNIFSSAKDGFEKYSRNTKTISGKLTDYKGSPESMVSDLAKSLGMAGGAAGGSTAITKSAMDMMRRCGRGSSSSLGGRPYDLNAKCANGKASMGRYGQGSGCDSASFNDLLNKLTGGGYNSAFKDIQSAIRAFMALANNGYKLGLCGVFGSLYNSNVFSGLGLSNLEFGKISGNLLGTMGGSGNVRGWIDIAKASTGLFPSLSNPASLDELMENFEKPEELGELDQVALMEQLRGGQELYDEDWMKNAEGELSFACTNGVSEDYQDLSEVWVSNRVYGEDGLELVPDDDDLYMCSAVVGLGEQRINDVSEELDWI